MSRKKVRESRNGVTLIKIVLFDGVPRRRIGVNYIVQSPRAPEGKSFDNLDAAQKYFNVQASLRPRQQ